MVGEQDLGSGPFRALRVRNYRIYASANLVSLTGTWMQRIGQDWLVLQLSGDDGTALGLVTALQFGPTLFLGDRKSTRLNSSHANISYAVFCLKKKKNTTISIRR